MAGEDKVPLDVVFSGMTLSATGRTGGLWKKKKRAASFRLVNLQKVAGVFEIEFSRAFSSGAVASASVAFASASIAFVAAASTLASASTAFASAAAVAASATAPQPPPPPPPLPPLLLPPPGPPPHLRFQLRHASLRR
jgi:hypothetical protein